MSKKKGLFLTFEGPEASGKSSIQNNSRSEEILGTKKENDSDRKKSEANLKQ